MENTNEDVQKDNETSHDDECCKQMDPREVQLVLYGDFMHKCFDEAMTLMVQSDLFVADERATLSEKQRVQTGMALALFNRCTREMPKQEKIFATGLEYLTALMKEKEADDKRMEELRTEMPTFAPFVASVPFCKHPGLRKLWEILVCKMHRGEEHLSSEGDEVIEALSVKEIPPYNRDVLLCPQCRGLFSVEKFKSGELWEEEGKEAEEVTEPRVS